ncbi:MAG TPA: endonuclease III [Thermoanaerobaculia bacterium]|jgi:endonuclease-3
MPDATLLSDDEVDGVVRGLHDLYPDADCELRHENPLELLVATILSAQATDQRVNQVTAGLFARYRTAADYAAAAPEVFEQEIRSTGFYRNKTRLVLGAAKRMVAAYGGEVPDTMDELVTLPGVARKTANLVLGTAFGKPAGVVVDTHVKRLAFRLGLSPQKDPGKIERDLMAKVPKRDWIFLGHALILHGRRVCNARKPLCGDCALASLCPRNGVERSDA